MILTQRLHSPWTKGQGFLILIAFLLLYMGLSAGHMLIVKSTVGFKEYLKNDTDFYTKILISGQLIKAFAIITVIGFIALKRYRLNWTALGFVKTTRKWISIAIIVALLGLFLRLLLMKWMATEMPNWVPLMQPPLKDLAVNLTSLMLFLALTIVITPIVEEIFFRGFLFQWFAGRKPVWLAALISSAMFGASHIVPPQAISAALMSFAILYLFVASGSLWPPIVCHMVNNLISIGGNLLASADLLPSFLMPPGM